MCHNLPYKCGSEDRMPVWVSVLWKIVPNIQLLFNRLHLALHSCHLLLRGRSRSAGSLQSRPLSTLPNCPDEVSSLTWSYQEVVQHDGVCLRCNVHFLLDALQLMDTRVVMFHICSGSHSCRIPWTGSWTKNSHMPYLPSTKCWVDVLVMHSLDPQRLSSWTFSVYRRRTS